MFIINTKTVEQIESVLLEGYTFVLKNPHVLNSADFDYDLVFETDVETLEEAASVMSYIEKNFNFRCIFKNERGEYDLTIEIKVSRFLELSNENK